MSTLCFDDWPLWRDQVVAWLKYNGPTDLLSTIASTGEWDSFQLDPFQPAILRLVRNHFPAGVRAFHCTRLTDEQLADVLCNGLIAADTPSMNEIAQLRPNREVYLWPNIDQACDKGVEFCRLGAEWKRTLKAENKPSPGRGVIFSCSLSWDKIPEPIHDCIARQVIDTALASLANDCDGRESVSKPFHNVPCVPNVIAIHDRIPQECIHAHADVEDILASNLSLMPKHLRWLSNA